MDRTVDIYTHESDMARMERSNARLSFLCITLIVILLATNGGWLYYESQFTDVQTTTIEAQQDGAGVNFVNGGDFNYGSESKDSNN